MLVVKIFICILFFIALIVARIKYGDYDRPTLASNIAVIIAGILGITFIVLLFITNLNLFIIPKILLFISFGLYILFKEEYELCVLFWIGFFITVIAFIIVVIIFFNNYEECENPDVSITSTSIICAKDNSSTSGKFSGGILYVQGSVSEESVYKYYYLLEDGGIKQGTIPADDTTIYFVESEEEAHLETIVSTEYWLNNNDNPPTRCFESSEETYKLYVPEGSVTNVYEFDAE